MIVAAGDRYDRLVSWGAITTSLDGIVWTIPSEPFTVRTKVLGVTNGPDKIVVVGDAGWVSYSYNSNDWLSDKIWNGNFQPLSIKYANNLYMTCGQARFLQDEGPYPAGSEVGMIFSNDSGENWAWKIAYCASTDSRFYNIRFLQNVQIDQNTVANVWIAVGSGTTSPTAIYSLDNGFTWNAILFPTLSSVKYAYDVVWNNRKFWFTTNGFILNTPTLVNPVWEASQVITPTYGINDLVKIASNTVGHMVAACSGGLAYTTDQLGWTLFSQPGYRFRSVIWYQAKQIWIASAESNLTQYTYWTSSDTINWTPYNNSVQASDFTVI